MQYTSNYHLSKPDSDDIINPNSRTGYNGNFDTLDTNLKSVSNKANANESNIANLQGDVADLDAKTGEDIPFESGSADSISDKITILSDKVDDLSVDYIVEQGTTVAGEVTWTYRKWGSGIVECWARKTILFTDYGQEGGWYYAKPVVEQALPPFISSLVNYHIDVHNPNGALHSVSVKGVSEQQITFYVITGTSYNLAYTFTANYSVIGRWK